VEVAVEGEHEADGVLGHGVGGVCGDAQHGQAEAVGLGDVDVVEAGGAEGEQARAAGVKGAQDGGGGVITDKYGDGGEAGCQIGGC